MLTLLTTCKPQIHIYLTPIKATTLSVSNSLKTRAQAIKQPLHHPSTTSYYVTSLPMPHRHNNDRHNQWHFQTTNNNSHQHQLHLGRILPSHPLHTRSSTSMSSNSSSTCNKTMASRLDRRKQSVQQHSNCTGITQFCIHKLMDRWGSEGLHGNSISKLSSSSRCRCEGSGMDSMHWHHGLETRFRTERLKWLIQVCIKQVRKSTIAPRQETVAPRQVQETLPLQVDAHQPSASTATAIRTSKLRNAVWIMAVARHSRVLRSIWLPPALWNLNQPQMRKLVVASDWVNSKIDNLPILSIKTSIWHKLSPWVTRLSVKSSSKPTLMSGAL